MRRGLQGGSNRILGDLEVLLHLHVGYVEAFAGFAVEMFDTVGGESVRNHEPRGVEDVPEFVFVLVAIEPSDFGAAGFQKASGISCDQWGGEVFEEL